MARRSGLAVLSTPIRNSAMVTILTATSGGGCCLIRSRTVSFDCGQKFRIRRSCPTTISPLVLAERRFVFQREFHLEAFDVQSCPPVLLRSFDEPGQRLLSLRLGADLETLGINDHDGFPAVNGDLLRFSRPRPADQLGEPSLGILQFPSVCHAGVPLI